MVIQIPKPELEPLRPIFKDIDAITGSQLPFPGWGELYRIFQIEDNPNVVPPSDPEMRGVDDMVLSI
jgi:hypothetical protein